MRTPLISFGIGAAIAVAIPPRYVLAASQELVSFVSLLMAGLLPAMILTATVIRGDRFSSSRVKEYGAALRLQLGFWAFLFLASLVSVSTLTIAKVLGGVGADPILHVGRYAFVIPVHGIEVAMVATSIGALTVILSRLWPAYKGLRSVLDLAVQMAELQGVANDRTLRDALDSKSARVPSDTPTKANW